MEDKKIGIQLKKARMESELSQEQVASKLGVTWEMVSRYENGRSSPHKHLSRLAKIYDKPASYFLNDPGSSYEGFDLKQLTQSLKDEGIGYNKSIRNVVKKIDTLSGRGIEVDAETSNSYYEVNSALTEKYLDIFALNLDNITAKLSVIFPQESIGLFSSIASAKETDIVLTYDGMNYELGNYKKDSLAATIAVLVKVELNLR